MHSRVHSDVHSGVHSELQNQMQGQMESQLSYEWVTFCGINVKNGRIVIDQTKT